MQQLLLLGNVRDARPTNLQNGTPEDAHEGAGGQWWSACCVVVFAAPTELQHMGAFS
jgi:hypothetical protein